MNFTRATKYRKTQLAKHEKNKKNRAEKLAKREEKNKLKDQ